jgi:hypothetical protein
MRIRIQIHPQQTLFRIVFCFVAPATHTRTLAEFFTVYFESSFRRSVHQRVIEAARRLLDLPAGGSWGGLMNAGAFAGKSAAIALLAIALSSSACGGPVPPSQNVPEPDALLLLGIGLIVAALARRLR